MTVAAAPLDDAFSSDVRFGRIERLAPFAAAALAFAVATAVARPYAVGVFHDDGIYAILAKAIATGQGYRYLNLPGAPAAAHYPPGYPLLLAGLWRLVPRFPANIPLLLLMNAVFLGAIAWETATLARRVLGWRAAAAAAAALVATLSLPLLMLSRLVLSEPMFVALLLPALLAAERLVAEESSQRRALAVGAACGGVMLVRAHGAALPLALVVLLAMRHHWRHALACVAGMALVLAPWELWQLAHRTVFAGTLRGSYGGYGAWLMDGLRHGVPFVAGTVVANGREIGALFADRFSLADGHVARSIAACLGTVVVLAGAVRMRRRAPVIVLFAAIYYLIILLWPFTPWRFVFALWPVVVLSLGECARWAFELRPRRATLSMIPGAALLVLAAGIVRNERRAYAQRAWRTPGNQATTQIAPLVRWVAANTTPRDVIAADAEQIVYLFTGRRAVPLAPFTAAEYLSARSVRQNAASLERLLASQPVTVVATISPNLYASASQVARSDSGTARLVAIATLPGGGVFRVEHR